MNCWGQRKSPKLPVEVMAAIQQSHEAQTEEQRKRYALMILELFEKYGLFADKDAYTRSLQRRKELTTEINQGIGA